MSGNHRLTCFIAGSFLASFGGWINFLAILNIATYRFDATPFDLVILSAALLLPSVLLTKMISQVCDRYPSTRVIGSALVVTLATTAALLWVDHFAVFLLVIAVKSAALGFTDPSEMRYVTIHVESSQQSRAFRLLTLAQNMAKICAPAAGAWVGEAFGDDHTMFASLILIAMAIVLMLKSAASENRPHETEAATTISTRRFTGPVLPLLLCVGICFALAGAVNNQFPLMLKNQGFDKSVLAMVVSCAALGGVLGSLLPNRQRATHSDLGRLLIPAFVTCVVFIAMGEIFRMPLHPAVFLLGVAFFSTGLVGARFRVSCRMYIARRLPDQVASVSATLQSIGLFVQFVAPCVGAVMTSEMSNSQVFFALGCAATAALVGVAVAFNKTAQIPLSSDPVSAD